MVEPVINGFVQYAYSISAKHFIIFVDDIGDDLPERSLPVELEEVQSFVLNLFCYPYHLSD